MTSKPTVESAVKSCKRFTKVPTYVEDLYLDDADICEDDLLD